jgi:hypothetical protein
MPGSKNSPRSWTPGSCGRTSSTRCRWTTHAAKAHELIESGRTQGKIVLTVYRAGKPAAAPPSCSGEQPGEAAAGLSELGQRSVSIQYHYQYQ